ncbi:hypothetical protein Cgig2_032880 [Carnegiea gigantea]|uniref:Uncharacterized protein n=1 Tax=Carnegiea gigantea TaxID=171969 RepID=A0A9Q1GM08_9CARY|nr:hypothetical protein Cgig2_032880 [Carnegiea gigantea]
MTTKVKVAVYAAYVGVPIIIASGKKIDGIIKVLQVLRIGTLFHKDAHSWAPIKETGAHSMAIPVQGSSRRLQERRKILLDIANALEANKELIKAENDADVTIWLLEHLSLIEIPRNVDTYLASAFWQRSRLYKDRSKAIWISFLEKDRPFCWVAHLWYIQHFVSNGKTFAYV